MDRFFSKKKTDDVCVSVELGVAYMTRKHTHTRLGCAGAGRCRACYWKAYSGTYEQINREELRAGDYRAARDKPGQLATIQFVLLIN